MVASKSGLGVLAVPDSASYPAVCCGREGFDSALALGVPVFSCHDAIASPSLHQPLEIVFSIRLPAQSTKAKTELETRRSNVGGSADPVRAPDTTLSVHPINLKHRLKIRSSRFTLSVRVVSG